MLPAAGPLAAETLTFGYDTTGQPSTLTGTIGATTTRYVSATAYLTAGVPSGYTIGPVNTRTQTVTLAHDPATLRLTQIGMSATTASGTATGTTGLTYDPAGNLTSATDTWTGYATDSQCFTYDYQRQLIGAWTKAASASCATTPTQASLAGPAPYWTTWTIDTIGKITARTDKTATTSTTTTLAHPADGATSVRPHATTSATLAGTVTGTRSYAFDASGNMTSRPSPTGVQQTLTWDDTGQLVDVTQAGASVERMVYGPSGNRLARQQNGATTIYVGGAEITLTGTTLSATRYYTHVGNVVAMRTGNTDVDVTSLIPDWQGTTHAQINNNTGTLTVAWQDPYGQPRGQTAASWTGDRGFVGGRKDATGLTRVGARDYDPTLAQFITVDPVQALDDPLQWNAYAYADNNPVTFSDPDGLKPLGSDDYGYLPHEPLMCTPASVKPATVKTATPTPTSAPAAKKPTPHQYKDPRRPAWTLTPLQRAATSNEALADYFAKNGGLPYREKEEEDIVDVIQTILDVVGCVPGAELADGGNAIISAGRGDGTSAILSVMAMVPIGGQAATVVKLVGKAGKASQKALIKATRRLPGLPKSAPIPLGRGSTGRTLPETLKEQLAMTAVRSNPHGTRVPKMVMKDSRWLDADGWVKMQQIENGVNIHYVFNTKTGEVDDFKFK